MTCFALDLTPYVPYIIHVQFMDSGSEAGMTRKN